MTFIYLASDLVVNCEKIESVHFKAGKAELHMERGPSWTVDGAYCAQILAPLAPNSPEPDRLRREVAQLKLDKARLERELAQAKTPQTGRGSAYNRGYNAGYQAARRGLNNKFGDNTPEAATGTQEGA